MENKALDIEYVAYCGVDCSACADLASGKCPGCRQTEWAAGDECAPVACCEIGSAPYLIRHGENGLSRQG